MVSEIHDRLFEKGLEPRTLGRIVRPPVVSRAAKSDGGEVKQRRRERFFQIIFSESLKVFGKSIDGRKSKVLAETLSLIGRLFEIYFVRLIGTPNQNSKNGANSG